MTLAGRRCRSPTYLVVLPRRTVLRPLAPLPEVQEAGSPCNAMRLRAPPRRDLKSKAGEEARAREAGRRPRRGSPCEGCLGVRGASLDPRGQGLGKEGRSHTGSAGELRVCIARRASELVTSSIRWGN